MPSIRQLPRKASLSREAYRQQAIGVDGKGALAIALDCCGPIGCMALMGGSITTRARVIWLLSSRSCGQADQGSSSVIGSTSSSSFSA